MIIPKAAFLRQAYLKHKEGLERQSRNEQTLAISQIAKSLRNPKSHKLGVMRFNFSNEEYPLLSAATCPEHLEFIRQTFTNAGYGFRELENSSGLTFIVDWRGSNHKNNKED